MPEPRVLLHAFSTFKLGGPQARFVQLANSFGGRYRHVVMAMDGSYDAGNRLGKEVAWMPLRMPVLRGRMLANRGTFRRELKACRPHLLLTYNWGAIEWAAANLPPVVPHVHVADGFGPEEASVQLPRRVWMRRALLGWPRVPVVVASRNLEAIARADWGVAAARIWFIPNGVQAQPAREWPAAATGTLPPVIGTVAGLRPEKNVGRLIRAFATLRALQPARLVIVGDGPERSALEALAHALGVAQDVEFAGYLADPSERMRAFDLFALSSNTEQLPMAMLEAMALGVPVLATNVGDVADILPAGETGMLSAPDDRSFTAALAGAVAARAAWPALGARCRQIVRERHSRAVMESAWDTVFAGAWKSQ